MLLTCALDEKFTAISARMAEAIPNATRVSIPDVGHTVHLEAPETFRRQVLGFLSATS
jgi:2-succinyl-6-hydroxy-2,4-cyclohexadiene-1-carboxylate synthase